MSQGTGGCSPPLWYPHQNAVVLALPSDLHPPWTANTGMPEDICPCSPCSATLLTYGPHCRRETGAILTHLCYHSSSCQGKCKSNDGEDGRGANYVAATSRRQIRSGLMGKKRRERPIWCLAEADDCWGWELPPSSWGKLLETISQQNLIKTLSGGESIQWGSARSLCVFRGRQHRSDQHRSSDGLFST